MQHCKITEQHSLASWVAFFLIALAGHAAHAQEKPSFSLEGFATVKAYWLNTTTGGGNAPVTVVKTPQEFLAAAERSDIADKKSRNNTPRIIRIANDLDLGVLANERGGTDLKSVGIVHVRSHTTIFAAGTGATIRHGTIEMHGAANVIIRNLKFRDLWEYDPSGKYDRFGWDFSRQIKYQWDYLYGALSLIGRKPTLPMCRESAWTGMRVTCVIWPPPPRRSLMCSCATRLAFISGIATRACRRKCASSICRPTAPS